MIRSIRTRKELGKNMSKKGLAEKILPIEVMGKILNTKKMAPRMLPKLELEEKTSLRLKMGKKT